MILLSAQQKLLTLTLVCGTAIGGAVTGLSTPAAAEPVTYTGFTITDGKLGTWEFHNARVYLTFQSDTGNVQFVQYPDIVDPTQGTLDAYINSTGKASVTIISDGKVVHARFAPNQIFVSLDQGTTSNAPHQGGRGVGFGSFSASAPGGLEPAYPLGINEGTIHWGLIDNEGFDSTSKPSPELVALSTDLSHDTGFSGGAWSCVGFPSPCGAATPLQTDKGDFYLYMPYWRTNGDNSPPDVEGESYPTLGAGFFIAQVGEQEGSGIPRFNWAEAGSARSSATRISYHGYVIADVTLGGEHYKGAQVYLTVDGNTATALPFNNGPTSYGFVNDTGNAHVTVISRAGRTVSAEFEPGQIYVYYDVGESAVGFGSLTGGKAYPLTFTAKSNDFYDGSLLVLFSTVDAVSQMLQAPYRATNYSTPTATLKTDLTNETVLSGEASSCVAFDPATSYCSNLKPVSLKTNRGNFYLFEPYREDATGDGKIVFSVNSGVFWSEVE
jgi:hypothetical protein